MMNRHLVFDFYWHPKARDAKPLYLGEGGFDQFMGHCFDLTFEMESPTAQIVDHLIDRGLHHGKVNGIEFKRRGKAV